VEAVGILVPLPDGSAALYHVEARKRIRGTKRVR